MREKFVRPLVGRRSREGRVRARFRRMRVESDVEFVLPVRLESRFLASGTQPYYCSRAELHCVIN